MAPLGEAIAPLPPKRVITPRKQCPRTPVIMKFILCFGLQNTNLKYGRQFQAHPVYIIFS